MKGTHYSALCVDSGAPLSVVGERTLRRIFKRARLPHLPRSASQMQFRFGDCILPSCGRVKLELVTPAGFEPITFDTDVVDIDIPALLGLDVMETDGLMPDNVHNKLCRRHERIINDQTVYVEAWFVPITRSTSCHLHVSVRPPSLTLTLYTRTELKKLHQQLFHPSPQKLFNLLQRINPDEFDAETMKSLQELAAQCETCQRFKRAPSGFRVSLGRDDLRFNERVLIDVGKIEGHNVLHVIDEATMFNATRTLPDNSIATVFRTFMHDWALIYMGMPNKILTAQGSTFCPTFVQIAQQWGTQVQHTGIDSHNSLNIGEGYHEPLRTVCRKVLREKLEFDEHFDLVLAFATKRLNDSLGPDGIVPSTLVFGDHPSLSPEVLTTTPKSTLKQRSEIAERCRFEMRRHLDMARINRALRSNTPAAAHITYEPGDRVLVWRDKIINSLIGDWLGPFTVDFFDIDAKIVYIRDNPDEEAGPFSIAQVKSFLSPDAAATDFIDDLHSALDGLGNTTTIQDILLSEVIHPADPHPKSPKMGAAGLKEVRGLIRRGTFRVVLRQDLPTNDNILPGRFILVIKDTDGNEIYKAQFCPSGHLDHFKDFLLHYARTLSPETIRLLLALAALFGFDVWTADVVQVYLQACHRLNCLLYLRRNAPEFNLGPDELLQVILPLYGIIDSGGLWYKTFTDHHRDELRMEPTPLDPALFFLRNNRRELIGLSGIYVDALLRAGTLEFKRICNATQECFEMTPPQPLPQEFAGFQLLYFNGVPCLDKSRYASKLEALDPSTSFSDLHSARACLAWLSHSRPDITHSVAALSQYTRERYELDSAYAVKIYNSAVKHLNKNEARMTFPKLNLATLRIVGYSDASFAGNADLSSQLGYIVLLQDQSHASIPLCFKYYKSRRVCRSVMTTETIAFADLFDQAITIRRQLSQLLDRDVPMNLYTDSRSLFDAISKGNKTSERRLLLDITAACEGFRTVTSASSAARTISLTA